ncbi:MAG: hypothetical protein CMJ57_06250 [Planctomycetaceae bacterium]|nr:hypothetical protein [Planctomycetaceae bacterium]
MLGTMIASAGGLSMAIFAFSLHGYLAIFACSMCGAFLIFSLIRRSKLVVQTSVTRLISQSVEGDDSCASIDSLDPEVSRLYEQIQSIHARTREESAARQMSSARNDELFGVLQALDDPVIVFDSFGNTRMSNAAAKPLVGTSNSIFDTSASTVFGCSQLHQQIRDGLMEGDLSGRRLDCEVSFPDELDSGPRIYDARLFDLDGAERGTFLLVLRDLTREREISRLKSDFVSKASHELRTPLASIRAYLELIVDDEISDPAECREVMNSMLSDTDRLSSLVENMLNISRIEAGIMRPTLERTDLGAIARKVVHRLEPGASQKEISLSVSASSVELTVEGDSGMLEQVLENLTSNAVKYTPNGGRVVVSVDTDPLERTVVVSVSDTGLGIPLEARERVFDKFFRVPSYERMAKGTGLGLNLCRNIVESVHQGRIGVDSRVGEGSRFWFSVPIGFAGARAA